MGSLARLHCVSEPPHFSSIRRRQSSPKPVSSVSITSSSLSQPIKSLTTTASSTPSPSPCLSPKPPLLKTLSAACVTIAAAAAAAVAIALTGFPKLAIAATAVPPSMVEKPVGETEGGDEECEIQRELELERHLAVNHSDVEALRSLMEIRIKAQRLQAAIEVVDRLIELEPDDDEWPLLKAQMQNFDGDHDNAKAGFEELLAKDPLRVEAYHGLVTAYHETGLELTDLEKRISEAMEKCEREIRNKDFRDFKLLVAQLRVIQGDHSEALKLYEELVKEEPRDCRPYLCQGILYSLLKRQDEAEKYFEMFQKLVPEDHPYREYFVADSVDKDK